MKIPFNRLFLTGNELQYMEDVLTSTGAGGHISGDGKYSFKVREILAARFGVRHVLPTTSCTSALELATHLLKLKTRDEVIVPSYTFSSTVNPILLAGARPVFVDIRKDSLNIDPYEIHKKITSQTRAIFLVHYGGVSSEMDEIIEIAAEHDLEVVEDAAQGVNAKYKGKYLGTFGTFGCFSFHESKNYTCGEGGALVINSDDAEIIERAEILREKGTNRCQFNRGEVDKYTWVDIGSSYLPSDLLMAFLYAQLEKMDEIKKLRMQIWNSYYNALKPYEESGHIQLPIIPSFADHNAHMFYVLFQDQIMRDKVMIQLQNNGIQAIFHYLPLHSSPVGKSLGYVPGDLPVTEEVSKRLLRLPLYTGMRKDEVEFVLSNLDSTINCCY